MLEAWHYVQCVYERCNVVNGQKICNFTNSDQKTNLRENVEQALFRLRPLRDFFIWFWHLMFAQTMVIVLNCRFTSLASYPRFLPIFYLRYLELGSLAYVSNLECSLHVSTRRTASLASRFDARAFALRFWIQFLANALNPRDFYQGVNRRCLQVSK